MALEKIVKNSSGVPTGEYEEIAGGTLYADVGIGTILPYGGTSDKIPQGYLLCDGTSLLRASYPELFAVIGTAFGSADSTHFNIPDMRESVPKGAGLTGHTVGAHLDADGLAVGEFLDDRLQDHTHELIQSSGTQDGANIHYDSASIGPHRETNGVYIGRKGATTEVKSVGVNYIIKAKMVALPADLASGVAQIATKYPDYSQPITINANPWTAPEDCYVSYLHVNSSNQDTIIMSIDGNIVTLLKGNNNVWIAEFSGYVRKGQVLRSGSGSTDLADRCLAWKLT